MRTLRVQVVDQLDDAERRDAALVGKQCGRFLNRQGPGTALAVDGGEAETSEVFENPGFGELADVGQGDAPCHVQGVMGGKEDFLLLVHTVSAKPGQGGFLDALEGQSEFAGQPLG